VRLGPAPIVELRMSLPFVHLILPKKRAPSAALGGQICCDDVVVVPYPHKPSASKKWSYGKALVRAGIVSAISLIFYTHTVMLSSSMVSALPVVLSGVMARLCCSHLWL